MGRARDCEAVLDDDSVSRYHCRIRTNGNEILLEGLKNLNPLLVNGCPVNGAILHPGDEIAVGASQFMVVADYDVSAHERSSASSQRQYRGNVRRLSG